ncbi:MAG: SLATT domain-containing protein [Bacteroidales bacterium]|nr:SLATT domain-containing protein [Bacteroidales bacterium]MBN2748335.1 SLATT domain-containing protein [Bacteroidales bacterium]
MTNIMNEHPSNLIVQIQEIHCDSKIGKSRHFIAADRKAKYHKRLGISIILISVFVGSTIISQFEDKEIQKLIMSILGFLAACLAAMQTFFNYSKDIENHRKTGNLYLEIARDCDNLISKFKDGFITKNECQIEFEKILKNYKIANKEEEICPNSDKDYKKAYKRNKENKERVRKLKNDSLYKNELQTEENSASVN